MRLLLFLTLLLTGCGQQKTTLYIYGWVDYIKPELIRAFEKQENCRVVLDTFDSNEAMYAKLRSGASGYDLIMPSQYTTEMMEKEGMLETLDLALIPNSRYIGSPLFPEIKVAPGTTTIPYLINVTCIAYNKTRVPQPIRSWVIFDDSRYSGRMTMLNDIRDTLGAALLFLGYSINTREESEVNAAADVLIRWKRNLAKFESEQFLNGLASAEYLIVHAYNGVITRLMEEDRNINLFYPREGTCIAIDVFAIPKGAPHKDLAARFINFMHEPQNAAENMLFVAHLSPNTAAVALLSDAQRSDPRFFPPKEVLERSEIIRDIGPAIRIYSRAWDRVKEE